MNGSASRIALVFVTASFVSIAAQAAPPPPASPPPVTPGQVQSTLPTQQPQPNKSQPATITQPGPTPSGVAPGGPAVKVTGFDIRGNTVIASSVLQAQVASYVGQTLTLAQLYDVADVLTRYYRDQGYGLAYVSLPAQTLKGGSVQLQVIEGRIGKVSIQGNDRTRDSVLQKRAAGLKSGDVYTNAAAERAVLLLNDLPGMEAHAVLSPGTDYGTSDVLFNATETHYTGDTSIDDYGRSVIGRWRVSADVNINSLTGSGDELTAGITHSDGDRLNFGKLSYALPVGSAGGTLTTAYNRAEYRGDFVAVGAVGAGQPFSGSTQNASVSWQYPEERSSARSFYWNAGLSWDNSRSKTGGASPTETLTSNLMLLQIGSFYTRQFGDQSGLSMSWTLWTNGKHYEHVLGGINRSAERARSELDTSYVHPFAQQWSIVTQANLSYSVNALTDADKFNLGGPGSVLGYQSAEERGDSGYFLSAELQRGFSIGAQPLAWGLFLNNGKVWDKATDAAAVVASTNTDTSRGLSSTGLDLQVVPSANKFTARLQWAYSIGRKPTDGDGGGHIWLTMGMTF